MNLRIVRLEGSTVLTVCQHGQAVETVTSSDRDAITALSCGVNEIILPRQLTVWGW
jgi:hypothetical protein